MDTFILFYQNWITFCEAWLKVSTAIAHGTLKSLDRPERRDMTRMTYGV